MPSFKYFTGPGKRLDSPYMLSYHATWEEGSKVKGVLTIHNEESEIRTAVKLPIEDLEALYVKLGDIMPWLNDLEDDELRHLPAS